MFFILISRVYVQDSIVYFSEAVKTNIIPYKLATAIALEKKDFQESKRLFDSLVYYKLRGTHFDNFAIKGYSSKKIKLHSIKKPLLLITYASWCARNKGDASALNKVALQYANELQIVLILMGQKEKFKEN